MDTFLILRQLTALLIYVLVSTALPAAWFVVQCSKKKTPKPIKTPTKIAPSPTTIAKSQVKPVTLDKSQKAQPDAPPALAEETCKSKRTGEAPVEGAAAEEKKTNAVNEKKEPEKKDEKEGGVKDPKPADKKDAKEVEKKDAKESERKSKNETSKRFETAKSVAKKPLALSKSKKSLRSKRKGDDKADSPISKKIDLEPPVIDEEHVQKLGNIDINIKEQKAKMAAEIEAMSSQHEFDKKQQPKIATDTHVVIAEKKCKQYETNNEETKEDDDPANANNNI